MKLIAAAALTLAVGTACGSTQGAHADPDAQFISTLKSHGLHPPAGMSEDQWEKLSIDTAHSFCDLTAKGALNNRNDLLANSVGDAKVINEAAVAAYCPQS